MADSIAPVAKSEEVQHSGRSITGMPGLYGLRFDQIPYIITTSEVPWHSTATNFSRRVVPYNFKLTDFFVRLITAPTTNSGKFKLGTTTDTDLFFVTTFAAVGKIGAATTALTLRRMTTSSAFQTAAAAAGTAGMAVQMTLNRIAAGSYAVKGALVGILVAVPR